MLMGHLRNLKMGGWEREEFCQDERKEGFHGREKDSEREGEVGGGAGRRREIKGKWKNLLIFFLVFVV